MDNLEWMTRAENIKHANENNLYPNRKKTPVLVMNVATGGVIRYSKLAECSKAHGITDSTVYKRATRAAGRIFDGFAFKLDDGSLWNVRTLTADRGREILAKNIFDDSISIFDDCNQASQILGINRGSIKLKAREKSNTPIRGFLFRKLKDSKDWPKLSQWHLELCKKKPEKVSLGWVVKDTVSGKESALFTSEVGDLLGFPENNIIRELRKGISPCLRYTFRPIEFV
ncbi:hypothetical protein ACLPJK_26335 [Pseudomonas aeruginosa]|uniref:hypothetical protein n=1 Tax=Pseudomonas aeruginosa TaxID=287 RepID=UPI003D2775C4